MDDHGIGGHGVMIADRVRVEAYRQALRRVVTPDSIVIDLGAGTGIFTLLACQLGARHVYAIERIAYKNAISSRVAKLLV